MRRALLLLMLFIAGVENSFCSTFDSLKFAQVSNENIYQVNAIYFEGNSITKEPILFRELAVKKDSSYGGEELRSNILLSIRNLNNTQLFNSVSFNISISDNNVQLTFLLKERWYIWPSPVFDINERNFNEWWKDKDISRVSYGLFVQVNNFRGRNETLNSGFKYGFDQALLLQHVIPYLDAGFKNGLSFTLIYRRNHEMAYDLENNELVYYKDNSQFLRQQLDVSLKFLRRPGFYEKHIFELEAHDEKVSDTILSLNPDFFEGSQSNQRYFGLSYFYSNDHRDDKNYPLDGYYFDFKIQKDGLFTSQVDQLHMISSFRYYKPLNKRFFYAGGLKGRLGSRIESDFSLTRFLGFSNSFVRGYEPYVIAANDYLLNRNNLRFNILPKKIVHLGFIPFKQFNEIPNTLYLNLHWDMGWASNKKLAVQNRFNEEFMFGGGIGLDYVTFYSLVMRLEYSVNRLTEHGFFINFTAPI